jgi:DNA-binding transcriptional ArsR family regulator
MAKLSDFITSRVRVKLLEQFLLDPKEMYYVRQLTRQIDEEINAVRRELQHLQEAGIIKSEKRGNRIYYQINPLYPFYPELLNIVAKTTGLGKQILKFRNKLGFVKYAFISTRIIKGIPRTGDQIDLMIIGDVIMPQLNQIIKAYEAENKTEVNYSAMTEAEFNYRKNGRDPFILSILHYPRVMLIGDDDRLLS